MQYKAFISYSHAADGQLAPALQSGLQKIAKPFYRLRAMRVFRDETSLHLTPKLWPTIQHALSESEHFILMASPLAAESRWVQDEVDERLRSQNGEPNKFYIVLTEGEILWNRAASDFDWGKTTALPKNLQGKFETEPLFLDFRWARQAELLALRNPQFLRAVGKLAAAIRDEPLDVLIGEDVRQHRIFRWVASVAGGLLFVLFVLASSAAYYAIEKRNEAVKATAAEIGQRKKAEESAEKEREQRKIADQKTNEAQEANKVAEAKRIEAEKQTRIAIAQRQLAEERDRLAQSRALAAEARRSTAQENDISMLTSVEAFQKNPSVQAKAALLETLSRSAKLIRYFHCPNSLYATTVAFSDNGRLLAFACGNYVSIFDTHLKTLKLEMPVSGGDVRHLLFLSNSMIVLGPTLRLLHLSAKQVTPFTGYTTTISALSKSMDEGLFFSGDSKGEVRAWAISDLLSGRFTSRVIQQEGNFSIKGIEYLPTHHSLLIQSYSDEKRLIPIGQVHSNVASEFLAEAGPVSPCLDNYKKSIRYIIPEIHSPDNRWYAYTTEENEIIVYDSKACLPPLKGHTHNLSGMAFGGVQGNLIASAGQIGRNRHGVLLWDVTQVHPLAVKLHEAEQARFGRGKVSLSYNGKFWACAGCTESVLWNGQSVPFRSYAGTGEDVTAISVSANGEALAIGREDGQILVAIRSDSGNVKVVLGPKHHARVWRLNFMKNGDLYSVGGDNQVGRWQPNGKTSLKQLNDLPKDLQCVGGIHDYGPSLAVAAYGGQDKSWVWFLNLRTGERSRVALPASPHPCSSIGYAPNVSVAIQLSRGYDPIYVMNTSAGSITTWENPLHAPSGLATILEHAQLSADGKLLAASSNGKSLVLFDVSSRTLIGELDVPGLHDLSLSEDGKRLITVSDDGLLLWNLDFSIWASKAQEIANHSKVTSGRPFLR